MSEFPSWEELIAEQKDYPMYRLLVQCIVTLSTTPHLSNMTMSEIYELMIRHAKEMEGVLT